MDQMLIIQPTVKVPNIRNGLMQVKARKIADAVIQVGTANIYLMAFRKLATMTCKNKEIHLRSNEILLKVLQFCSILYLDSIIKIIIT